MWKARSTFAVFPRHAQKCPEENSLGLLLSCVFVPERLCRSRDLMIPARPACLTPRLWNTSIVCVFCFFFQGRNFSCSFMNSDYRSMQGETWGLRSEQEYLHSTHRDQQKTLLSGIPPFCLWKEGKNLILWKQQKNTVSSSQTPCSDLHMVSHLSFISPSLCLFQTITHFTVSECNLFGSRLCLIYRVHRFGCSETSWNSTD